MESLIKMVDEYRTTKVLKRRLHLAETIIIAVQPKLFGFLLRRCRKELLDDVLQETLIGIARNLHMFHGNSEGSFYKWCFHVAKNKSVDSLRKKETLLNDNETGSDTDFSSVLDASAKDEPFSRGERLDLDFAIKLLRMSKPACLDYLWEYYILDRDYNEIGMEQGLDSDTVRMRIRRCLEVAQSLLQKMEGKYA